MLRFFGHESLAGFLASVFQCSGRFSIRIIELNYEHNLAKRKTAGVASTGFFNRLPTVDNLRNFFLTDRRDFTNM
jgi:hypothetical protein